MIVVACDCLGFCFCFNFCSAPPHVVGGTHQEIVEHTEQPATGIHVHVHVVIVVVVVVIVIVVIVVVVHKLNILNDQHDHIHKCKTKCEVTSNGDPLHS